MTATALVTNTCSDAGLSAAGSLARAGYRVIGVDTRRLPGNVPSRFLRASHVVDAKRPENLARELHALVERVRPEFLLPLGTAFARAACAVSRPLARITSFLLPDARAFDTVFDKTTCASECLRVGVPAANIISVDAVRARLDERPGETFVVKPHVDVGASEGVSYVRCRAELEAAVKSCDERWGGAVIQEYVEGPADAMKTAVLLFGQDGQLFDAFTMQKRRQWPTSGGLTAASESIGEAALVDAVLPFFEASRWRGPAEVEFKHDRRTGIDTVVEINPRLPAYLRFAGYCDLDFPARIAEICRGDSPKPSVFPAYRVGARYVNPGLFVRAVRSELRAGVDRAGVLRGVLRDLRDAPALVADMLADPLPAVARAVGERGGVSVVGELGRGGAVIPGKGPPTGE